MKLVTTAQQLRSALNLFRNIIETRNTFPVLGTVLFDGARVRGTNLDMELVVTLVASEASGKAAIDYRSMSRLVALIPSDDIVTILGGKDSASILFSSGRYDLPCCDPSAYPDFKWSGQGATLAYDALGATISAVHADFGTGREFLTKAVVANVGAEQTVSFRSDYMITLLRNFARHDRVRLDIIDANSPMRLSVGGDAYTILMPMRGANEKLALATLHEVTAIGRAA